MAQESFIDVVRERAGRLGERCAFTFLGDGENASERLSYAEVDRGARSVAAELQAQGAAGERVLLLFLPGLDFVAAFLGCLYAGAVAVPAYPPSPGRGAGRLRSLLEDAKPRLALTTPPLLGRVRQEVPEAIALAGQSPEDWRPPEVGPGSLAFLQYTSGSTSTPKGVRVTHGNLIANEHAIQLCFGQSEESVVVGWLPLYHDMGLIGNVLQPLWCGATCVLMSPLSFLQRPRRWLEAIDRFRGTTSGGPDFAYSLCVRKVPPAERAGLDLSSWRVAFNGAEPVRAATLDAFAEAFAPCGFRREAFYPCYGLAEATLFVSGGDVETAPRVSGYQGQALVSCGRAWPGERIAVVDPEGRELAAGEEGEICVSGPSVADGYWNGVSFGGFLRTGDLGRLDERGELFVTGRLKDLIVVRGRNFYPHDVERTAEESHPALRPGGGAAFSVEVEGEERLVVVHEVERRREAEAGEAAEAIRAAVVREHEVSPRDVVPIRAGTLPKTSSGKVRRGACRDEYLSGALIRLGLKPQARRVQPLPGLDLVRDCAARLLHVDPESLDPEAPLPLDSLLALELKNRLEETGVSVSLTALLEGISPRRLAEQVTAAQPFELPAAEGTDHPLSWNQRSLWLAWRMAPESPVYNLALAARVSGEIDFQSALQRLAERHAVLRTTYPLVDGEPVQRIGGSAIDFAVIEDGSLEEEAWRPFDLERGPVMRARLFPDGVLLLAVHHIAADFWSLGLILEETAAPEERHPPSLGFQPQAYAAWARWQRDMLAGPQGERLWAGWREALAGAPTVLDLPADRPRPATPTHRGGSVPFSLGPELSETVRALAAASGTTLYTVLLAAFAALLHRHTGRDDLLVGAPAAGRTRPGLEDVAGHFVNLLPLRADLSGDPAFPELLARTRRTLAGALELQDLPFPVLVERLDPARDPSRPPLVQVVFALEQPHRLEGGGAAAPFVLGRAGAPLRIGGLSLEPVELPRRATAFDLALLAVETGGTVDAVFEFSSDLFDPSTIERLARRFLNLLRDPSGRLSELAVLDPAERAQLLSWGEGPAEAVPERCVHELFEDWADRTPDAPALVGADGSVATYRELEARANRLARHLLASGVGLETPVALLLERSPELWTAALAVLKAGGWYVPIDPGHPKERIELLVADLFPQGGARVVVTRELLEASEGQSPERPRVAAAPDNLAYGLYTSGSTGRPKAVLVPHRPLLNVVRHAARDYRVRPGSRVLQWSAPLFDTSVLELFAALTSGAALCLASEEARLSGPRLVAEMRERSITWAALTPAAFRFVPEEEIPSIETISVGGEALPAAVAARWSSRVRLFNAYGPTEAAIYVSVHFCRPGEEGPPPIGRPISNARLRVLAPWSREPLPAGVPGELCAGGAPRARGYLGRPDLTAERWMPDENGERLYRTGDLVRWRPDGELEFLGRIDTQVKLRGVRIEPAEVEAALATHPHVREAVVVPRPGAAGEPVLVAYVVLQENLEDVSAGLRAFLAERLPAAMIPSAFVPLAELPLTPVGKVDLRALPLPASIEANAGAVAALPRTEMERTIAAVWREVLGIESVGIDRNFFELGGHSLLMARAHARLCETLGRQIPLAELFSHTTISSLAARLAGEEGSREAAEDIHDRAASRRAAMDRRRALRTRS